MCLSKAVDFVCRKCSGSTRNTENDENVTLNGNVIKKYMKFSYLEDLLSSGGGVQEVVPATIGSGWKNFRILKRTM